MAKIFTVVSGKGGVGKSTFCVNTALSLGEKGHKVLLIDGDIALRSLDLLLNLEENLVYDWSDIICNRCDKTAAILPYNDKVHLLPAPLEMPDNLNSDSFKELIDVFAPDYDFIFIDSPAGVGELQQIYALVSNQCIVVATPDNVSARSAYVAGNLLVKSGVKEENLRLVINRFNEKAIKKGNFLNIDEIIDITYLRLLGIVPEEPKLMYSSVSKKGLPTRSEAKLAFKNIAGRILGKEIPLNL
ncbi:MAG: P-loop NTPase [Clostridia bacterium]|nr:P-loop NTPase [Clostridia bacterium]